MAATAVILAVLSGAVFWSAVRTAQEREDEVKSEAASTAVIASAYVNQYLDSLDSLSVALVRHPAVTTLNRAECDRMFAEILRSQPLIMNMYLADTKGVINGSGAALDASITSTTGTLVNRVVELGRPVVGELRTGRISHKPFVGLGYPVRDDSGKLMGVLSLGINLTQFQLVFERIPLPRGSVITLSDAKGRIIARSLDAERYIGRTFTMSPMPAAGAPAVELRQGLDDVPRFYGDTLIARGPWRLSVGIPEAEVFARLRALWTRNAAIILFAIASVLLLSLWLSSNTSLQLAGMQLAAKRIAEGDLSPPAFRRAPNLEIAQLQGAFSAMAVNLRDMRDALDARVEQERKMRETLQSLQRQVVRQERLAAVGVLVSGVAHELNNPLQAILGAAELIEQRSQLGPEARVEIDLLKTQSSRARDIIRNLSRFSSQQSGPPEAVNLREVIAEVVQLRRRDLEKSSIALDVEMRSNRKVFANFTELEQVTLNFVINAQQSIEGSGRAKGRILIRLFDDGKRVRLEVQDDGPGVTGLDEPKLFQPFFTTKAVGQGTGLGLSVSYGIIDSYGGAIGHAANEWGGATFFFSLSAVDQAADDTSAILLQA